MLTSLEQRLCQVIAARDGAMRADLARHVAIPTGHNHTAGLDEYRGLIVSRLEKLGARTEYVPGDPKPDWLTADDSDSASRKGDSSAGRTPPTAVCRMESPPGSRRSPSGPLAKGNDFGDGAETGSPRVLIAGHLDTVFDPRGPFLKLEVSSDGTRAVGPGVVDMKGGILIAVHALEALAECGVRGAQDRWTFLLNSDEETGSYHSERALRAEAARHDIGLAVEPALPDGSLAIERKGSGQFLIETFGRSAHAGRDFASGVSAVYALARTLVEVEKLNDLPRGITVNVGPLVGGKATNVVPDYAAARGNVRFPDAQACDELAARLDRLATPPGVVPGVRVRRSFNRPAKVATAPVRSLAQAAQEAAKDLGFELGLGSTGGVCDGNILQDAGLPTIDTLGVRGGGLHTHEEWIDLKSLVERSQLFGLLLLRAWEGRVKLPQ